MTLDLATMRTELREHLGVGDEFATPECDLLLNRSWWEIQKKFKFRENEMSYEFDTIISTRDYNLPSGFAAIERLALIDSNGDYHQMKSLSIDEAIQATTTNIDSDSTPTHYQRRGDVIKLYPTPNEVFTMVLYYQETLADLISTGPPIPQEWHEIILYGAIQRGHARYGSVNKSAAFAQMQAGLIASCIPVETKELEDTRYAQVQVMKPRYP